MNPLDPIRNRIDQIDSQLLQLLSARAECVHEVGEIKRQSGQEFYAPEREEALLKKIVAQAQQSNSRLPERSLRAIYREIMSAALALETKFKIAYLGPAGTWTHQAAINKFGNSVEYVPLANFSAVFDEVSRQKANYGVVPIENSTEGAINHTLDLFADSPLKICAQVLLPINNCLIANIAREKIQTLYSHPQVFGQCKDWILKHFPKADLVEASSTTKAAELAMKDSNGACLGGKLVADLYNLHLLEESIQDRASNTTRFLILSRESCPPTGNDRTSIMFAVHDRPGSLIHALKPFEDLSINMSKIESRPNKRKNWEYFFFVDLKGHENDSEVARALAELDNHCSFVKILGSYPDITDPS